MVIFNSYVKLPEGMSVYQRLPTTDWQHHFSEARRQSPVARSQAVLPAPASQFGAVERSNSTSNGDSMDFNRTERKLMDFNRP